MARIMYYCCSPAGRGDKLFIDNETSTAKEQLIEYRKSIPSEFHRVIVLDDNSRLKNSEISMKNRDGGASITVDGRSYTTDEFIEEFYSDKVNDPITKKDVDRMNGKR